MKTKIYITLIAFVLIFCAVNMRADQLHYIGTVNDTTISIGVSSYWRNPWSTSQDSGFWIALYDVTGLADPDLNNLSPVATLAYTLSVNPPESTTEATGDNFTLDYKDSGEDYSDLAGSFTVQYGHTYVMMSGPVSGSYTESTYQEWQGWLSTGLYDGTFSIDVAFSWNT